MPRALKVCSTADCPELTDSGRCTQHRRTAESQRGSARRRGYDRQHETRFRHGVLTRDPMCVCTTPGHGHGTSQCLAPSTVADHHPRDRRTLVALGLDPHDPQYGRGLCAHCHNKTTPDHAPGGWHRPG